MKAQANAVLGTTGGHVANMVVSEVVASGTDNGYVTNNPELLSTYLSHEWLIDTGANIHICVDITLFVSYQLTHGDIHITYGHPLPPCDEICHPPSRNYDSVEYTASYADEEVQQEEVVDEYELSDAEGTEEENEGYG